MSLLVGYGTCVWTPGCEKIQKHFQVVQILTGNIGHLNHKTIITINEPVDCMVRAVMILTREALRWHYARPFQLPKKCLCPAAKS